MNTKDVVLTSGVLLAGLLVGFVLGRSSAPEPEPRPTMVTVAPAAMGTQAVQGSSAAVSAPAAAAPVEVRPAEPLPAPGLSAPAPADTGDGTGAGAPPAPAPSPAVAEPTRPAPEQPVSPEAPVETPSQPYALSGAPLRGDPAKARVAIVAFSDFECPYCSKAVPLLEQIEKHYGEDVVIAFRHFPLGFHERAEPAARAAIAAQEQGKFWEYHDKLFANQENLTDENLAKWAVELGLDAARLQATMKSGATSARISADRALAEKAGIDGTPSFLVNGLRVVGALPFESMKANIEAQRDRVAARMQEGRPLVEARDEVSERNVWKFASPESGDPRGLRDVSIDGHPGKGAEDPLVAIVEFSDFQCPHCAKLPPVLDKVLAESKDVRVVFRHMPLSFHEHAQLAAEASMAAREMGKFWELHDKLFANQQALARADIVKYAAEVGIDVARFEQLLDSKKHAKAVAADAEEAARLSIDSTPSMVINGRLLVGAEPYEKVKEVVDAARKQAEELIAKGTATRTGYYQSLMKLVPKD